MGHVIESDSQAQCNHAHFVVVPRQRDCSRACSAKRIAIFREGWRVICGRSTFILIRCTNGKVWGHLMKSSSRSLFLRLLSFVRSD